jgi:hypothetical protein
MTIKLELRGWDNNAWKKRDRVYMALRCGKRGCEERQGGGGQSKLGERRTGVFQAGICTALARVACGGGRIQAQSVCGRCFQKDDAVSSAVCQITRGKGRGSP